MLEVPYPGVGGRGSRGAGFSDPLIRLSGARAQGLNLGAQWPHYTGGGGHMEKQLTSGRPPRVPLSPRSLETVIPAREQNNSETVEAFELKSFYS